MGMYSQTTWLYSLLYPVRVTCWHHYYAYDGDGSGTIAFAQCGRHKRGMAYACSSLQFRSRSVIEYPLRNFPRSPCLKWDDACTGVILLVSSPDVYCSEGGHRHGRRFGKYEIRFMESVRLKYNHKILRVILALISSYCLLSRVHNVMDMS